MLLLNQYPFNKSIMVGILGRPNAGKSSLVNYLLGFDLSAVTPKAQTTRNQFHCNFIVDHTEIVLVDTPGLHRSNQELNKRMVGQAVEGGQESDVNLLLLELGRFSSLSSDIGMQFSEIRSLISLEHTATWVVFTKSDLCTPTPTAGELAGIFAALKEQNPKLEKYFIISSKTGDEVHSLMGALCDAARPGPHLYPQQEVSNRPERFFVAEYIREQAFLLLNEELPYELAVTIDAFKDLRGQSPASIQEHEMAAQIQATIHVNRASQRSIVIGSQGGMIREIGSRARKKIEALLGGSINLKLHVKVSPKWFRNNFILEELGLPRVASSNRVWRKK